jgi:predicted dehydrogenase
LILRDLVALGCTVHTVARSATSQANAREFRAHTVVDSIDALPSVAGAVVATPTTTHYEMIRALLPRRIPLFVEKPLVSDPAQLSLLRADAERLFVMDKWRYHSGVRELARLVRTGELGRPESVHCTRWGWKSKPRDTNVLWYLAPHDLAIVLDLLGEIPNPVSARFQRSRDGTAVGCVALLGHSPWVELTMSEVYPSHIREVRVCGSEGTAVLPDSYSPFIVRYRWPAGFRPFAPDAERIPITEDLPLRRELEAFVAYLQGGAPPKSAFADAAAAITALVEIEKLASARG